MSTPQDFLFEIFTEELPPKALKQLSTALSDSIIQGVKKAGLSFSAHKSFATPRRLAIIINDLAASQPEQHIERKGPAIQAAYDKDGKPTKAALGFAKSCNIELSAASTTKTDRGEWLYYQSTQPGKSVFELMPNIVTGSIKKLPIPKLMRWGAHDASFVRPIHNVLMLFGDQVIDAQLFHLQTNNKTFGHRFHAPNEITITQPSEYQDKLNAAYVMADFDERQAVIKAAVDKLAHDKQAKAVTPNNLLDEVTSIVEWPIALLGTFEERFLQIPKEVLILSMQTNQKYFALLDQHDKLTHHFITISNIDSADKNEVIRGNERVIRARFADAEFFFNTDQQTTLASKTERLSHIIFQKQLGSLQEKTSRVTVLSEFIAQQIATDTALAKRAASLSKADLVTDMVGEFPELQGVMGRYYAAHDQEPAGVAQALDELYMPRFSGDQLPQTKTGMALAISDRLDTLVGIFGINKIPSGEKDPFALRRAALGVLRIIIENALDLDLSVLIDKAITLYQDKLSNEKTQPQLLSFFHERLKNWSQTQGIRPDVFQSIAAKDTNKPYDTKLRLDAVMSFVALPEAQQLAAANKRVKNILKKNNTDITSHVDRSYLKENAEKTLAALISDKQKLIANLNYQDRLLNLADMQKPVDQFFDDVMVMDKDENLKNNRLALLNQLRQLFTQVADISYLDI